MDGRTDSLLTYRDPLNINIIDRRANCPRPPIFKPPPCTKFLFFFFCSRECECPPPHILLTDSLKSSSQTRSSPVYTFNSEFTAGHQLEPTPSQCDTKNPFFSLLLIIKMQKKAVLPHPVLLHHHHHYQHQMGDCGMNELQRII